MGVKVKGGMWCDYCQMPVAGQKSTKKMAKLGLTLMAGGAYAPTPDRYHCPSCGSPVRRTTTGDVGHARPLHQANEAPTSAAPCSGKNYWENDVAPWRRTEVQRRGEEREQ